MFSSYKSAYSKLPDKPKFINTGSPILPQTKPSGRYIIYNWDALKGKFVCFLNNLWISVGFHSMDYEKKKKQKLRMFQY